jgi:hypothetical protein
MSAALNEEVPLSCLADVCNLSVRYFASAFQAIARSFPSSMALEVPCRLHKRVARKSGIASWLRFSTRMLCRMFALGRRSRFIRKALLLVAGLLLVCGFGAQDRDFSKVEIKVSNVAGNVYILEGVGENIGASVGEDGIVLVDDN